MRPDTDTLPPTQLLILEVLAARYRTGETTWSFPTSLERALLALQSAGLVATFGSTRPKVVRARLTDAGRTAALLDGYTVPAVQATAAERDMWRHTSGQARAAFDELLRQHLAAKAVEKELRRLLDQTAAALNVALHCADLGGFPAAELDGCREALRQATEACNEETGCGQG